MDYIFQAIGIGFLLSVMVGPVFFVLLETSITKGVRASLYLDLGVFISDVIYILFAFIFAAQIKGFTNDASNNNFILGIIGGILFVGYGIYTLFSKSKNEITAKSKSTTIKNADSLVLGIKGFMLNFANPAVLFYWIGIIAQGNQITDKDHPGQLIIFVSLVLLTYFAMDVLKILGAKKLRPLVTGALLLALNRLIGIIFTAIGVFLILKQFVDKP
ncbi:MAG: LysE family translocator [Crocinitomicaceae bacterium]|jgi:threonine/homoserine/homoserine lactone efflux protein|nr:LysE family translocator [Crocinitomicaceae bacterium]